MKTIILRGIEIGAGRAKVCVPLTGANTRELAGQAKRVTASGAELVEWRADCYEDIADAGKVKNTLALLRDELGELPLLFTLRTCGEGGSYTAGRDSYAGLLEEIVASGLADAIDAELFMGEDIVRRLVYAARKNGVAVIVSNHDFAATPERGELVTRLERMRGLGADIPKIAVTPKSFYDVLELMAAVYEYTSSSDCPVIAMSMTKLGCVSRIAGQYYGSAVTFGSVGSASAPGQLEVGELIKAMDILS